MSLKERYDRLCTEPSDIVNHLPRFVEMVLNRDARHVVELGTRTGVSTVAWLYALEQTGGRLTSVDIDEKPGIGDHPHWSFIQGDDLDPDLFADLEPADIVFIDTSHAWEQTRRELSLYRWLVNPGGLIVCHDTELMHPEDSPAGDPPYPVKKAIYEFGREHGYQWRNYPDCYGLGVIEIP
jgi:predicted O-methyltransferase YrrM